MRFDEEKYTITVTDGMCQLISEALVDLFNSDKYDYDEEKVNTLHIMMEQFRNLGSKKVPEVTEVHMVNPDTSIDVVKRESI